MLNFIYTIDWSWCAIVDKLRIRGALFFGYDKLSVLKRIEKINREYKQKLENERIKYESILEEKENEIVMLSGKKK